jgi:hypothetical protein
VDVDSPKVDPSTSESQDDVFLLRDCDTSKPVVPMIVQAENDATVSIKGGPDQAKCAEAVKDAPIASGTDVPVGDKLCVQGNNGVLAYGYVSAADADTMTITWQGWNT